MTKAKDGEGDKAFLETLERGIKDVLDSKRAKISDKVAAVTAGAKLLAIRHRIGADEERNFFS